MTPKADCLNLFFLPFSEPGVEATKVFLIGSLNSVQVIFIDLVADTWTTLADSPLNIKMQYNNRIVRWEDA